MKPEKKKHARPLLWATVGVGVIAFAGGCYTSGNLMAPRCEDRGLIQNDDGSCSPADAGTSDGGSDGGVLGGDR